MVGSPVHSFARRCIWNLMIGSRYTYIVWSKMVPHIEGFRPAQVLKLAKLGVERDHLLHSLICKETWFHLSHTENMPQRKKYCLLATFLKPFHRYQNKPASARFPPVTWSRHRLLWSAFWYAAPPVADAHFKLFWNPCLFCLKKSVNCAAWCLSCSYSVLLLTDFYSNCTCIACYFRLL